MTIIYTIINGILLGGLYTLFGTGLALTFGIMRTVNLAHGDMIVFGSFMSLLITRFLGLPPFISLVVLIPAMFLVGQVLQHALLNRTLQQGVMPSVIMTFGLSVILQNAMLLSFSADRASLPIGSLATMSLPLSGDFAIGVLPLINLATAVLVLYLLHLFFRCTMMGRAFRATSDDPTTVELMGVSSRQMYALAMGIAFAVIAVSAVFMGARTNFSPLDGPARLIFAFEVVIIGGMGSLKGVLAGGLILGIAQALGGAVNPAWFQLAGHVATLLVLAVRPSGLFPETIDRT
ncbi:MAG: Inner-rane translocator [Devosia sp.]|uniref:branched-chain amino acid ABC transporter permease n=1 Tax=Devosia sp. TaxID=1871048 RepID=UPI00262233E5|nr:branched-chain amino acid ABC transporter permease [Devosia sp.]MDB5526991.1 Inner-rane translocator [Devosia sp.]